MNLEGLSLSELNKKIKDSITIAFPQAFWVVGEISEMRVNSSGHCYIEMIEKDSKSDKIIAKQKAIIWAYTYRMISPYFENSTGYKLETGLKILVNVKVEYHETYGISLIINDIDPNYTIGDLTQKKKEIIRRLKEEGVISMNKMIPLPIVPQRIAIISSETAAGLGDFMSTLKNNSYGFHFYTQLFPATMQGSKAENSIMNAFNEIFEKENNFDVVVIIRGGGATSDLECFNNYHLAYYITQFPIVVITGIGHERDETISDIVAHTSLKTPTAVAEFLILSVAEFYNIIGIYETRIADKVRNIVNQEKQNIRILLQELNYNVMSLIKERKTLIKSYFQSLITLSHQYTERKNNLLWQYSKLTKVHSVNTVRQNLQNLKIFRSDLQRKISQMIQVKEEQLSGYERNVDYLNPSNVLKRGFSITSFKGKIVRDASLLKEGDILISHFHKGEIRSKVNHQIDIQFDIKKLSGK